ncbi:MAG TPA: hypothetical protein VFA84_03285 [Acidimicrobiales bacterium]|nr:hypothetical protein [Acidimicrobiales bacterium]
MTDRLLPEQFSDLEPFAATWCLPTERQRFAQRMASTLDEMQAFYDALMPRAEDAIAYCDGFPLDAMPDDAQRLLQLLYSLIMVSFPVEAWRQPRIPDTGAAYLDLVVEPQP